MEKEKRIEIYDKALKQWGVEPQVRMVFEECSELMNALSKTYRGRATKKDVITELVDVVVMCEQMAVLFGYEDFEKEMERKLSKFQEKLKKTEGKKITQEEKFKKEIVNGYNN